MKFSRTKVLLKYFSVAFAGLLAIWIVVEALDLDGTPESWLFLKLFHPGSRSFEVSANIEIDGVPIHLQRVVECKPKFAATGLFGFAPAWYQSRYAVSERLGDGAGVMMTLPAICSFGRKLKYGYDPMFVWVDSADNPQVLEAYYNSADIKSGRKRIRLINVNVTVPTSQESKIYENDFADLFTFSPRDPSPRGIPVRFTAPFLIEVPPERWMKDDNDNAALNSLQSSGVLPEILGQKLEMRFGFPGDEVFAIGGWYPTDEYRTLKDLNRTELTIVDALPLSVSQDGLRLVSEDKGTLRYFRDQVASDEIAATRLRGHRFLYRLKFEEHDSYLEVGRPLHSLIWRHDQRRLYYFADRSIALYLTH
nr:hypothetical protein [uncultured Dongia sp.]